MWLKSGVFTVMSIDTKVVFTGNGSDILCVWQLIFFFFLASTLLGIIPCVGPTEVVHDSTLDAALLMCSEPRGGNY